MSIKKFRAGRVPTVTASQYIGEIGTIFYDEDTGQLRISDGSTPGGHFIQLVISSTNQVGGIKPGPGFLVNDAGTLSLNAGPSFYLDETNTFRLRAGTETQIGGVKSGNGIVIASDGTINLDTEGLSFVFGDFFASTAIDPDDSSTVTVLSSVNADEGIVLASNGVGKVQIVGEFHVHNTDMDVAGGLANRPVFSVLPDGFTKINVPSLTAGSSGLLINGNGADPFPTTVGGVTLRTVGNDGVSNTVAIDAHGTGVFPSVSLRCTRGTGDTPSAIQSGDTIGRIAAVGFGSTTFSTDPATGRAVTDIRFIATEDYTDVRSGSKIEFYTSPTGGTVRTLSATILPTGITASTFTGNLTGNVTGTVSGNAGTVTNGVYTTDTGTVTNTMLAGSIANNKLANSTISGAALGSNLAALTAGTYITSTGTYTGATARTFAVDATSTNTASKVVARDASGNFAAGTITANTTGTHTGLLIRPLRDAGVIADGGTLTIDFNADSIIIAEWGNGITLAYTNYIAGRIVKLMAYKTAGTGTDNMSLDGVTAGQVSTGSTTVAGNAGQTTFVELISTSTSVAGLYIKL